MKNLLLFFLLFVVRQAGAQTSIPEKIQLYEQEIAEGKVDEIKMLKNYIDLITFYSHIDINKTHFYFNKAIVYAQEKEQLDWESAYWRRMAEVYYNFGKIDSSYYCIDKAIALVEGKGYDYEQCANYQTQGGAFFMGHEYEKSLNAYLQALELNNKDRLQKIAMRENVQNNFGIEASIHRFISRIYSKLLNYNKAIDHLLIAKKILDDNPTDRTSFVLLQIELHGELAELYMTTKQPEKALPLLNKSYELAVEREFLPEMVLELCRLSNFYCVERKDFNRAITFTKEALQIAEKTEMPYLISYAERNMMKVYFGLKDYQSSSYYAERALSKTEEGDWDNLQDVYGHLIMIYALLNNVSQAELYVKKYNEVTSIISDKNLHNSLQEMAVKYETTEKQLEIERQQTEIAHHKARQQMFIGGLALAGLLLAMLVLIVVQRNRRNRQLAEINALKDKFFSIISHDLKNPVLTQHNALQLLSDHACKWDAGTLSDYSGKLLKSSGELIDLLKNLLNWSLMQSGKEVYSPIMFNLTAILQPEINIIKSMAASKNITFDIQTPPTAIVTADENMLKMVVRNLLANAVKFTASGGTVTLEITPHTTNRIPHTAHRISVSDTGIGMSDVETQCIASLRTRSKQGTAGEHGTGLGLIVCKEMLAKHGSTLNVESEEGKGSRFWFTV
jgi:signal transduction histidine kinase